MIRIFDYEDYKLFTNDFLLAQPNRGRGQYAKMALVAQTHKATISQIFRGEKHLGPEQALRVAHHLGLAPSHVKFFVLLVSHARAGSEDLRNLYRSQLEEERELNRDLTGRIAFDRELTGEERATYYSSWLYSAVRMLSSIPKYQTRSEIRKQLRIPLATIDRTLDFLLENKLCVESPDGKIKMGPQSTYLDSHSPFVVRHHGNWRVKAMEKHPYLDGAKEMAYTAPMTLSGADVKRVREILSQSIEQVSQVVGPSPCEAAYCLNIDWFEVK